MKRERVRHILTTVPTGSEITVKGWVRTCRKVKDLLFVEINDGSDIESLQVVAETSLAGYSQLASLTTGASLAVSGTLMESPAAGQRVELHAKDVEVYGPADAASYPLQKKRHSFEFLREIAHLRPRTNTFGAVFRVRNCLAHAVHTFFQRREFLYVTTPIITANDCEGAGELFHVTTLDPLKGASDYSDDFFGKRASLTVSGQLEGELFATALDRIYTFGPTFRAENSNTSRHLAEFWMVEPEAAFSDINDNMDLAEDFLKFIITAVLDECPKDMAFFDKRIKPGLIGMLESILSSNFERMTYTNAVDLLIQSKENFEYPVKWGSDLKSEHERFLTEKKIGRPVILTDYPRTLKPFYMYCNDDNKTVRGMDVLVSGIGEIIGGSEREYRLDLLLDRMKELHLNEEEYGWYLDTRRFGTVPHSGFGLGFERAVQFVTGMENIRDVIPFARTPKNLKF
ncbi:MAG: asparagine--tRNA ligase [Spirochaetes bacterium]|nr:asparagine--tRNA ligase [Spirochaetota bacterium]